MNANWSGRLTFILIVAITLAGFFLWLGWLFFLWLFLQVWGASVDFWAMTEALSTAVAAAKIKLRTRLFFSPHARLLMPE